MPVTLFHRLSRAWQLECFGGFALALLVLDRFLKQLALSGYMAGQGAFRFELFKNEGVAFSLPLSGPFVWLLSAIIVATICVMAVRDFKAQRFNRVEAMSLFVFGACSNLFDRIIHGFTVDYLMFFSRSAVNIADGMIVAGALWLVFKTGSTRA